MYILYNTNDILDLKSFAKVKIYEGLAAVLKEPQVDEKTLETMIRVLVNFSNDGALLIAPYKVYSNSRSNTDANRKVLMEVGMIGPLLELLPRVKDPQLQETSRLFVANLINDGTYDIFLHFDPWFDTCHFL